jgi:hypothetical protein
MSLTDADIQNLWTNDFVQKNPRKSYHDYYPAEYAAVAAFINGGAESAAGVVKSKLGLGLVAAERDRRAGVVVPPPPSPTPTWTSSINEGDTVKSGVTWSVTIDPAPDSVEFWQTGSDGVNHLIVVDTDSPFSCVLNMPDGNYILGVVAIYGTNRVLFDDRKHITISSGTTPPPPSSGTPGYTYFDSSTLSNFKNPPWTSLQSDVDWNGAGGPSGETQLPSGHVAIIAAPDGDGKAIRFQLPDSDPPWPLDHTGKRSQVQMATHSTWNSDSYTPGTIRWFEFEIYLPWNKPSGEYFQVPDSNGDWFTLIGLHPNTSGVPGWGCWDMIRDYPAPHPIYLTHNLAGGGGSNPTFSQVFYNAIQLTNADGTPYMANYNRRINLVMGAKFAPDTSGWSEVWVDRKQVLQIQNHPTTWTGDYSTYFKFGPYMNAAAKYSNPSHACTVYLCKLNIGMTRPF